MRLKTIMNRYKPYFKENKIQASQVAKDLNKAGWTKKKIVRVNFQNVEQGDYTISSATKFGAHHILIYPLDKNNVGKMMKDLQKYNPVYDKGYIQIDMVQ